MIRPALLFLLVSTAPAAAVDAYYETYAAGVNVANIDTQLDIQPARYRMLLEFRTVGALNLMFNSRQRSVAEGVFRGGAPVPTRFTSSGTLRGDPRVTEIDYPAGQPLIRQLVPPNQQEREPVPPNLQAGTVDTLSAISGLLHRIATTGSCDGSATTYDGRRLAVLQARTIGNQVLPPTGRSSFAGPALRCDFVGRQTGGFMLDEDRARLQRPQEGSAWFATVNGTLMPVRLTFHTRWFGDATMYLATRR